MLNTEKFREKLVPKLTELAGLLTASVTVPDNDGDFRFYDELASVDRAVEYGNGGFDLYDLGNFVSELGINYSEFNGEESVAELTESRNEYTDLSVAILNLLADDSLLYHRYTDSKSKPTSQTYRRDREGKLRDSGKHFYSTTGLSLYFDRRSSWSSSFYSEQIDGMLALNELDEGSKAFLSQYRESVMLYSLAGSAGRAVSALKNGGASVVTADDIIAYWKEKRLWEIDNSYMGVHNSGVRDVCAFLERAGYDVQAFIADKARQQ